VEGEAGDMLMRVGRQLAAETPLGVAALTAIAVVTTVNAGLHPVLSLFICAFGLATYHGVVGLARESRQRRLEARSPAPVVGMREWERLQWEEVGRELDRSRRHGRPFVMLRVVGAGSRSNGSVKHERAEEAYRDAVRSIDRVWTRRGDVYLLLPECTRATAQELMRRLNRELPEPLVPRQVHVAAFPEDGITQGALLRVLDGADDRARVLEPLTTLTPRRKATM
jgi:hypothetical protein